jgi:hypothetical protein
MGFCPLYKILSGGVLTGGVLSYIRLQIFKCEIAVFSFIIKSAASDKLFYWLFIFTKVMGWVSSLYDDFVFFVKSVNWKSSDSSESEHTVTFNRIIPNLIHFNLWF